MNAEKDLDFDIKRSIILAEYIKCWGVPEIRELMPASQSPANGLVDNSMPVELYVFPGEDMDQVTRLATIGLSSCKFSRNQHCHDELLMVLPFDVADDQLDIVSRYMFEIAHYIVNTQGRNIQMEDLMTEGLITAPKNWPSALLFDEPRGEPNELNHFYIGMQHVKLSWVVPIFQNEYDLIKRHGIAAFDTAINQAELSLVEIRRESCL